MRFNSVTLLYDFLRYMGRGNTGMAIMDIGILTGFKPDQKSVEKVSKKMP